MRAMAVDFGSKRIGIAVGESAPRVVSARPFLTASGTLRRDAEVLAEKARGEAVERVVLGIPIEPSGEEGRLARVVRQLAALLEERGLKTALVDETLTSAEAERALMGAGLKASVRKRYLDGEAAGRILERYFDETNHA